MSNQDKIIDFILKNATKLEADKITALGSVLSAVRSEVITEPNDTPSDGEGNESNIMDDHPIDMAEVMGVKIDNNPAKKIKIIRQPNT